MRKTKKQKSRLYWLILPVLLFVLIGVNYKRHYSTLAEINQPHKEYLCNATTLQKKRGIFLKIKSHGRLGNQMFEWFSALGIAKENCITACGMNFQGIERMFNYSVPKCPERITFEVQESPERGWGSYQHFDIDRSIMFHKTYLQSFKYFGYHDLRQELKFRQSWLDKGTHFLEKFVNYDYKNEIIVGIHLRRGDISTVKWSWYVFPPSEYFSHAIKYFESKYNRVKFIVGTDGYDWARNQEVFQKDNIFFTGALLKTSAGDDFSILSNCNHTITSVGSFGWWIGHLAGGEVMYYFEQFNWNHKVVQSQVSPVDYFPKHWIRIENKTLF